MSVNSNKSASEKLMHEEHKTTQHVPTRVNGELIETVNSEVNCLMQLIKKERGVL